MAYDARVFRILIASPGDVEEERNIIARLIQEWNDVNSSDKKVVLLPLMWEANSHPQLGDRPQAIINRQIVDSCDMLVGVFWTRIGTNTGKAESGTIEEIERVGNAGKFVMLYFSKVKVELDSVDFEQYKKLKEFKSKTYPKGLVESYSSLIEFRDKFSKQLAMKLPDLIARDTNDRNSKDRIDPSAPRIELTLFGKSPDQIIFPSDSLKIEKVVCRDIEQIFDLIDSIPEKYKNNDQQNVMLDYYEKLITYFEELVKYYCAKSSFEVFRLAISNIGEVGVRDLFLDINLTENKDFTFYDKDFLLSRPYRPNKPNRNQIDEIDDLQAQTKVNQVETDQDKASRVINIGRDSLITSFVGNVEGNYIVNETTKDLKMLHNNAGWNLKLEVRIVQPQRIVTSNTKFTIEFENSCTLDFNATVYSGNALPFSISSSFKVMNVPKSMSYREIGYQLKTGQ